MKLPRRALFIIAFLLLCLLLSCCAKKTGEPSDEPVDSSAQSGSQVEETTPYDAPDPLDALLRCVRATEEASSFSATLEGTCSTQVLLLSYTQQVRSERTVTADAMFSQSVSVSSLVRVGVQQYFQGNTILVRNGEVRDLDNVKWADEASSVTPEAYRAAYGNTPRSLSNYLITAETVLSVQLESASEDEITVVCELDPAASSVEYAKQVQTNGGLDELPVFSSVELTVTMDGAYRPIRVGYREVYDISIAILGKTTCKTDYVETFSDFNAVTSVPERDFFEPFLSISPTAFPQISGGYSLLFALLGNSTSYDVTLEAGGQTIPIRLSLDAASGAILLRGNTMDLLYENDRYYLLSAENHVFADAEELNRLLLPLTEQLSSPGEQEQSGGLSSLFSDMRTQTKNGNLLIQAGNEKDFFHANIDIRSLSLLSAEVCFSGPDGSFRLHVEKTEDVPPLPALTDCTDITPSLSAFSFLDVLPALRNGETLSALLQVEGGSAYGAELALSMQDGLRFALRPTSGSLSLAVYGQGETVTAIWEELAIAGTYEDFPALLALFSGTQTQRASQTDMSLPRITAEPGKLTLRFTNGFSLTFAGSEIRLSDGEISVRLSIRGTSARKVSSAPKTASSLLMTNLTAFLSDSVYPALLRSEAITGDAVLTLDGEDTHFRLRARLKDSLALGLTTVWNGAETDLLYTEETLFLSHPAFDAFLPLAQLSTLTDSLSSGNAQSISLTSVSCDGKQLVLALGETKITMEKDRFIVSGPDWIATGLGLTPADTASFTPPDKANCIDLAALAERVMPLISQKDFAFAGSYEDENFSATLTRFSFSRGKTGGLTNAVIDLLPEGASTSVRIFYDGGCLFFDMGETRLFCLVSALFPNKNATENVLLPNNFLSGLKKVTFRNDILEVETEDAHLRFTWDGNKLSGVSYSSGERTLSLRSATFASVQTPPLEQYTDITPLAGLLQAVVSTMESGSVAFDGRIDLRAFSLSLTDVRVSGAFRLSGAGLEGTMAIVLPYLPGLTSDGVPMLREGRLLTDCTLCSELFFTDGKLYMRRTMEGTYGLLRPQSYTFTETAYLTAEEALTDPMRALAFLLRLEPHLIPKDTTAPNTGGSTGTGSLLKYASCTGNRYTLALNPEALLPFAESILLTVQTEGGYVTGLGAEINFPYFSIALNGILLAHGTADLSPVMQQDFSGYSHLHN